jgi:hypothetical protein
VTDNPRPSRLKKIEWKNGGHSYSLDGRRCPGVTTIINQTSPAGGLLNWYARISAEWCAANADMLESLGPEKFVKAAADEPGAEASRRADRGRDIHAAAYALADGQPIDVSPDVAQAARLVVDFFNAWDVKIRARECAVYHGGHRYAGQFDVIADLSDGQRWLIDYKTGNYVMPSVALQLAAYRNAEYIVWNGMDMKMPHVDACGVLHVTENQWEFLPVDTGPEVFAAFLNSLPLYRFHGTKYGYDRIGSPLPVPGGES